MEIKCERIGVIHNGIDGSDEYLLLTCLEEDLTPDQATEWLYPQVWKDSSGAGSYYCTTVLAVQGHRPDQVIATVQHRYDV